jgi:UDP-glucuronate decarboxylase
VNSILKKDLQYMLDSFGKAEVFSDKTILITGFGGFLGYYFTQLFMHLPSVGVKPKKLILLDNFMLGRPAWVDEAGEADFIQIEQFDIAHGRPEEHEYFRDVDYVIHMASIASPVYYRKFPIETIEANILGLKGLLDYYKDGGLSALLFFSSSEIYGDPDPSAVPLDEEYNGNVSCIGPRSCYDESKRFGETLCYYYAEKYGMPIGVARPFNNFGPGMSVDDKRVPADFAKAVLNGQDITILSDGLPKRTFCYVADAICGYLKVLTHGRYGYFNIGIESPELSVREFAAVYQSVARELTGYDGQIRYQTSSDKDYLTNNPNRRCPKIEKARKLLGYNPGIDVEEGVRRFLLYLIEEGIR